ncbi:exonuclease domain-containing protein [Arthrobacter agilis]|uniref:exonuclease domain-containing protein n=1 Tax=Arthrobacter agilis TaxID=37921 RepID=UPI002366118E|nr:exonuclease domain-containing protein [Arthrobacter agilis]WDF34054.1 exonuclease domain-containing protein [Arthrobacter agilis]
MQGLNFTAIDFETANSSRASVCSVGLAKVRDGVVVDTASWLIRPPAAVGGFAPRNIDVHGIRPADVRHSERWPASLDRIMAFAAGDAFVAHNASFDRSVLRGACAESGLAAPETPFHCSVALSKRLLALEANRLPQVATALGLGAFTHHDAGSDAAMCAAVVVALARRTGLSSLDLLWPTAVRRTVAPRNATPSGVRLPQADTSADRSHPLFGQTVVFAGTLATLTRADAMGRVAALGATPANNVTKKTTMLVVGRGMAGGRSVLLTAETSKERRALEYIGAGQVIRTVGEGELREWLGLVPPADAVEETAVEARGTLESAVTGLLAWIGRRRVP